MSFVSGRKDKREKKVPCQYKLKLVVLVMIFVCVTGLGRSSKLILGQRQEQVWHENAAKVGLVRRQRCRVVWRYYCYCSFVNTVYVRFAHV